VIFAKWRCHPFAKAVEKATFTPLSRKGKMSVFTLAAFYHTQALPFFAPLPFFRPSTRGERKNGNEKKKEKTFTQLMLTCPDKEK
jgi:hypothetical protein